MKTAMFGLIGAAILYTLVSSGCARCESEFDCLVGEYCNAGLCTDGCNDQADCALNVANPYCILATNQCGECLYDLSCPSMTPHCNAGRCECEANSECGPEPGTRCLSTGECAVRDAGPGS